VPRAIDPARFVDWLHEPMAAAELVEITERIRRLP
jgi:hypothetical protein